jgi:hypothetical protein
MDMEGEGEERDLVFYAPIFYYIHWEINHTKCNAFPTKENPSPFPNENIFQTLYEKYN